MLVYLTPFCVSLLADMPNAEVFERRRVSAKQSNAELGHERVWHECRAPNSLVVHQRRNSVVLRFRLLVCCQTHSFASLFAAACSTGRGGLRRRFYVQDCAIAPRFGAKREECTNPSDSKCLNC